MVEVYRSTFIFLISCFFVFFFVVVMYRYFISHQTHVWAEFIIRCLLMPFGMYIMQKSVKIRFVAVIRQTTFNLSKKTIKTFILMKNPLFGKIP